jgi:hypothetical protein
VPDVSRLALPAGAEVISETRDCASGGCWIDVVVTPLTANHQKTWRQNSERLPKHNFPGTSSTLEACGCVRSLVEMC